MSETEIFDVIYHYHSKHMPLRPDFIQKILTANIRFLSNQMMLNSFVGLLIGPDIEKIISEYDVLHEYQIEEFKHQKGINSHIVSLLGRLMLTEQVEHWDTVTLFYDHNFPKKDAMLIMEIGSRFKNGFLEPWFVKRAIPVEFRLM